jgi:hypothetical protein
MIEKQVNSVYPSDCLIMGGTVYEWRRLGWHTARSDKDRVIVKDGEFGEPVMVIDCHARLAIRLPAYHHGR